MGEKHKDRKEDSQKRKASHGPKAPKIPDFYQKPSLGGF